MNEHTQLTHPYWMDLMIQSCHRRHLEIWFLLFFRSVMNNDPSLLRKLEQKETQERQLTEEWTEKWKEAAQVRPPHCDPKKTLKWEKIKGI